MDRPNRHSTAWTVAGLLLVLTVAALLRLSFWAAPWWEQPQSLHQFDEAVLPREAVARWEGVAPSELGWPAATTRNVLSVVYAGDLLWQTLRTGHWPDALDGWIAHIATYSEQVATRPERAQLIGRTVAALVGVLVVLAAGLAGTTWSGRRAGLLAAAMVAVSPVAVRYSQLVLADMTGVLFASLVVAAMGAVNRTGRSRPILLGVLVALAATSKFHFGLWLLPPLVQIGMSRAAWRQRLREMGSLLVACVLTSLLLVPEVIINPPLVAKEFLHVVASKVVGEGGGLWSSLVAGVGGMGALILASAAVSPAMLRSDTRRLAPLWVGFVIALALVLMASPGADRYGLPLLPAAIVVAAAALDRLLSSPAVWQRAAVATAAIALAGVTIHQLATDQRTLGQAESSWVAKQYILEHLPEGGRIATHAQFIQPLPLSQRELDRRLSMMSDEQAYPGKAQVNGLRLDAAAMPFASMIANDSRFVSFWLRRAKAAGDVPGGLDVTTYKESTAYYGHVTREAVVDEFLRGLTDPRAGYDILVLHHAPLPDLAPTLSIEDRHYYRVYIYDRSAVLAAANINPQLTAANVDSR